MILRLAGVAMVGGAAGMAAGVTAVLAACTVAQVAKKGLERRADLSARLRDLPPSPLPPAIADITTPPVRATGGDG